MSEPTPFVLTFDYLHKEDTLEYNTLEEAERSAEYMDDNCKGYIKKITRGTEVLRDFVCEYAAARADSRARALQRDPSATGWS